MSASTTRPGPAGRTNGATVPGSPTTGGSRSTTLGAARRGTGGGVTAAPPRLPSGRAKTPPAMIALAVLLTLLFGALAGAAALAQDENVGVVAAARDLPAGTVISEEDLRAAEISGSGLAAVRAEQAGSLLGQTVLGPVPEGTLLNDAMLAAEPPPGAGSVAVGLSLAAGQVPAAQLEPGREVAVYRLPDPAAAPATAEDEAAASSTEGAAPVGAEEVLVERAEVLSVTPDASGSYLVSLVVAPDLAAAVTAAGASNRVALGLLPLGEG